jgi:hypothetical protein
MNPSGNLRIFLLFSLLFALNTKTHVSSWNDASRMATIQSIVEDRSFAIDQSIFIGTGDKYLYNGHFYSDKPPMLAILAVPVYFILHSLGFTFESNPGLVYYLITLITIGLLSALGLSFFRLILIRFFLAEEPWADIVTLVCGTATLVFVYSVVFNNHMASSSLILIGLYYFFESVRNGGKKNIIISALVLTLAGTIDVTIFLFPFAVGILFMLKSRKAGLIFGISGLLVFCLYLFLNHYTSGSILPPSLNIQLWDYPGSQFNSQNLSGLSGKGNLKDLGWYAFQMILGDRGLISLSPVLLFAIAGFVIFFHKYRTFEYRIQYTLLVLVSLLFVLSYIFRSTNYSGASFGVRWYVSIIPIFCLSISFLKNWFNKSTFNKVVFLFLLGISILLSLAGSYSPFAPGIDFNIDTGKVVEYPGIMGPLLIIYDTPGIWKLKTIFTAGIIVLIFVWAIRRISKHNW